MARCRRPNLPSSDRLSSDADFFPEETWRANRDFDVVQARGLLFPTQAILSKRHDLDRLMLRIVAQHGLDDRDDVSAVLRCPLGSWPARARVATDCGPA